MKKRYIALATAGLTVSLGAFAALSTEVQPFQVVVPNLKSGMEVTLEGLYLRPSNSNLDYATIRTSTSEENVVSTTDSLQTLDPDYNLGFRVGLGYIFPNSGNDVQVAWTHYNHTATDATELPMGSSYMIPIYNGGAVNEDNAATVSSDVKFKLDSIDVNVGQYIDIGSRLRMRLFGGLRFAQLTSNQSTALDVDAKIAQSEPGHTLKAEFSENILEQFNSKFSGVGPQFGVETNYHIGHGFGIAAHGAMALLVGNVNSNVSGNYAYSSLVDETIFDEEGHFERSVTKMYGDRDLELNSNDATRIVPALDAKVGLNWSHAFENQSVLTLEGGYQWTQYIDAVDKLVPDSEDQIVRTTSSVGFDGPYLALNWSV